MALCCLSSGRRLSRKGMLWRHLALRTQLRLFRWFGKFYWRAYILAWTRWSWKSWMDSADTGHLQQSHTCYLYRICVICLSEGWTLLGVWSRQRGGQSNLNHKFSCLCIWYRLGHFEKCFQLFVVGSGFVLCFILFTLCGFDKAHFHLEGYLKIELFSWASSDPWAVQSRARRLRAQYGSKGQLLGCPVALGTTPSGLKSLTSKSANQLLEDSQSSSSRPASLSILAMSWLMTASRAEFPISIHRYWSLLFHFYFRLCIPLEWSRPSGQSQYPIGRAGLTDQGYLAPGTCILPMAWFYWTEIYHSFESAAGSSIAYNLLVPQSSHASGHLGCFLLR